MNISKRFNIYCYFPELISSGTDGFYFLNCLQVFGRRLTLVFYQQLHVVVNSPSSVLLLPSASCQRCVYSFPSVCDLYPSSETALLQLSTTSVTRTKKAPHATALSFSQPGPVVPFDQNFADHVNSDSPICFWLHKMVYMCQPPAAQRFHRGADSIASTIKQKIWPCFRQIS